MIRRTETRDNIIDLDGPEGNAFILLAKARELCKSTGVEFDDVKSQMTKGDYIQLVKTFDQYFGEQIILETTNPHYLLAFTGSN